MLEKTAGDDVTWLLHEAGLARALLIWECSLYLLLPRAGLSGHFQENEKNPAREILWWLKVPLKSEFWIVGRKPELTKISALYLGILERLIALRNLESRRTREVVQLKFTSRTPLPTKPKPLPWCSPRSCIYKSNTF